MLESLSIPRYANESSRDNAMGADNQQERPVGSKLIQSSGRHDFSRAGNGSDQGTAFAVP
jgi:hypothetical protein